MKYAIKKLDDTKFKSHEVTLYFRIILAVRDCNTNWPVIAFGVCNVPLNIVILNTEDLFRWYLVNMSRRLLRICKPFFQMSVLKFRD